ncbi:hypothetical protein JCM10908_004317 [Rhodotorula pacifica]|uniref:uncharacterized protein n=1 Tax=Rhodotorula pacifica TaxID=1495444 RepID=UPI00317842A1
MVGQGAGADCKAIFLPDEIIEKIFQHLLRRRLRKRESTPCRDWADYLTLSKRFYAILRPIWLSDLSVSGVFSDSVAFQVLMRESDLCSYLRSLKITVGRTLPFALAALLYATVDLQEIVVDFEPVVERDALKRFHLPPELVLAFARLPRLRRITFLKPVLTSSALPSGFPSLYIVKTYYISMDSHLETFLSHSKVWYLRLLVDGAYQTSVPASEIGLIPWNDTLRRLTLESAGGGTPNDMSTALESCLNQVSHTKDRLQKQVT